MVIFSGSLGREVLFEVQMLIRGPGTCHGLETCWGL